MGGAWGSGVANEVMERRASSLACWASVFMEWVFPRRISSRRIASPWLLWVHALAVALLSSPGAAQRPCNSTLNITTPQSELDALLGIYGSFLKFAPGGLPGWNGGGDPCAGIRGGANWGGVVCQSSNNGNCSTTVSGLQLTNLQLEGSLNSTIVGLPNLSILNIGGNPGLTGQFPDAIGTLAKLVILDLHDNGFNGSIPTFRDLHPAGPSFSSLQFLDLSGNKFNGSVPVWLGNLKQLQRLDLSNNLLSGGLPVSDNATFGLNNLKYLVQISFSNNNLTGTLDYFNNLTSLRILNGSYNHLNGTLPRTLLSDESQLAVLDLSSNNITGGLPDVTVSGLQQIYLANNNLNGNISSNFLNSSNLQSLNLDRNRFSGTLDLPLVRSGSRLQLLSLVNNSITDVIFPNLTSLLSTSKLASSNLLFLGGNPYCSDPQSDLLLQICRSNPNQILTRVVRGTANKKMVIIVVVIAVFLVLLLSILSLIVIRRLLKRIKVLRGLQNLKLEFARNEVQPNLYSYTELKVATEDFSPDMRLGQGGFGVVYKGVLPDGTELAVKQLTNSEQGLAEFLNEIVTISCVKHRNLVKLKGCCVKGDQRLLVYEYVENKNLAEALWDAPHEGGRELDWTARFNIILGIARGLAYLHEEVTPAIIHRDVKPANILLDKDLNPKIGDFGLALLFPTLDDDRTHLSVNIAGTKGYLSPEYASYGQVSEKVDVFSFGILILEIISGRKNINLRLPAEQRYILEWAWKLYEADALQDFIDPKLVDKSREEDIKQVMRLGLACVQYAPGRRPTMSNVVSILLGHLPVDTINRDSELSKEEVDTMFATIQTSSLTPVSEDSPLLVGLPTASASGAFIELGKLKPR